MFYFAWVDSTETTFTAAHMRFDEKVLSFECEHLEGQIPTLSVDIKNRRGGGLRVPGQKAWAWLAYKPAGSTITTPLFFGQLLGFPSNVFDERMTLSFIAKALDYDAQKAAVAAAMKVAPFYDPIFIDAVKRDDPDTILEGYSALWHADRVTGTVTASDLLNGEDGTVDFYPADLIEKGLSVTASRPVGSVHVTANVTWTQTATGTIDFGKNYFITWGGGDSIVSSWPKTGAQLAGGWSVESGSAKDVFGTGNIQNYNTHFSWQNAAKTHQDGDTMSIERSESGPVFAGALMLLWKNIAANSGGLIDSSIGINIPAVSNWTASSAAIWAVSTELVLRYNMSRPRTETIAFTLASDLQTFISADTPAPIEVSLNGSDVGVAIDGTAPIGDGGRRTFFPTDRGLQAVEYCLSVARAHALADARCIEITEACTFAKAIALSCRMMARFHDPKLPGGSALGKIKGYKFSANTEAKGKLAGSVTIGCAIGNAGAIAAVAGTPVYADDTVLETSLQVHTGAISVFPTSDVGYAPPVDAGGDGLTVPLTRQQVTVSDALVGSLTTQTAALEALVSGTQTTSESADAQQQGTGPVTASSLLANALANYPIGRRIELLPVAGGSFAVEFDVTTLALVVPKQIDLAGVP